MVRVLLTAVALGTVLLCAHAVPEDVIPPPALRTSNLKKHTQSPPAPQVLVQTNQDDGAAYVDADGDTHVSARATRGQLSSTDHLKDNEFFLNVPFSEMEFDSVINVTWVRPAAQMSKLDYIGLYQQGDSEDAIPCNWEFATGEEATGTVSIQLTNHGNMELRYFDVAADRSRVALNIVVYPPCPNNCTNNGKCEKGVCVCFPPYEGEECCEVGGQVKIEANTTTLLVNEPILMTLTPPAGELDKRNWVGIFELAEQQSTTNVLTQLSGNHTLASPKPLLWRYANETVSLNVPPHPGRYIVRLISRAANSGVKIMGESDVIWVHTECPNKCSDHGVCVNGTCLCDTGYDHFADCSIGNGLVSMKADTTSLLAGSYVTITWERNSDGGFSNLDFVALFAASDVNFDAPFAYAFAQPDFEKTKSILRPSLEQMVDRGTLQFQVPFSNEPVIGRYFRKDHVQFSATEPVELYFDCLPRDCNGNGQCVKGVCQCSADWKGQDCSIGVGPITLSVSVTSALVSTSINATWSRPTKIGSNYDFVAIYPYGTYNNSLPTTFRYANSGAGTGATVSVTTLRAPSRAGLYVVRYIDAYTRETVAESSVVDVHLPCPNHCSGHGTCQKDTCVCQQDWTARSDCSAKVGVTEISVSPLSLSTPSNRTIVVTYKRPEGSGAPSDFIGLFPSLQTNLRHPVAFAQPQKDFGVFNFSVPFYEGEYKAIYVQGEEYTPVASSVGVTVTKACLNECSHNGKCVDGTCVCEPQDKWTGADCSVGKGPTTVTVGPKKGKPGDAIVITYTRPANSGDSSDVLGIYRKGESVKSGLLGFVLATDNDHDTVEGVMPSVEAELEVHYIHSTDQTSRGHSSPFSVAFPCKEDCHSHGDCKLGFCTCHAGWDGFACDVSVPTAFVLRTSTSQIEIGGSFRVEFEAIPRDSSPSDFIALYTEDDTASANVISYEYTSMQPMGTVNFNPPKEGNYMAKYVCNKGGVADIKALSTVVSVTIPPKSCAKNCSQHGSCDTVTGLCSCDAGWDGNECATEVPTEWTVSVDNTNYQPDYWVEATWTRPPDNTGNYLDMMGIYETGPTRKLESMKPVQYLGSKERGEMLFKAPTPDGNSMVYELKIINGATGEVMAKSPLFTVTKPASK